MQIYDTTSFYISHSKETNFHKFFFGILQNISNSIKSIHYCIAIKQYKDKKLCFKMVNLLSLRKLLKSLYTEKILIKSD